MADPTLGEARRSHLVKQLMEARRVLRRDAPEDGHQDALRKVAEAKQALGERGAVWWTDGTPDYNRKVARNTPYAEWFASLALSKGD